ncbi:hypothetical protein HaLaN_33126 [Haematococcus lacustris]|uniref:Uncharacterized protein n=1 Tax=Haematococcus lacustris TaxID=44745 RepID=A0A6A0AQ06_HAELA|nr:hypothetical protein HaLaN_33126 [Haematococcus lacustris]
MTAQRGTHTTVPQAAAAAGPWVAGLAAACRSGHQHSSSGRHLLSPMCCMFSAAVQSLSSHLPGAAQFSAAPSASRVA